MSDSLSEIRDDELFAKRAAQRKVRRTTWRKNRRKFKPKRAEIEEVLGKNLQEMFSTRLATIKSPVMRLSLDATQGTPALATMLAKVLEDAGAKVICKDKRVNSKNVKNVNLRGLTIHIGQLTWVREEEAERW